MDQQARRFSIKQSAKMVEGRHFQTLDGRKVTIGESERMEITEQE